jgi:hypothetical protein
MSQPPLNSRLVFVESLIQASPSQHQETMYTYFYVHYEDYCALHPSIFFRRTTFVSSAHMRKTTCMYCTVILAVYVKRCILPHLLLCLFLIFIVGAEVLPSVYGVPYPAALRLYHRRAPTFHRGGGYVVGPNHF